MKKALELLNEMAGKDAQVIWGHSIDKSVGDGMRVTVIATRFSEDDK